MFSAQKCLVAATRAGGSALLDQACVPCATARWNLGQAQGSGDKCWATELSLIAQSALLPQGDGGYPQVAGLCIFSQILTISVSICFFFFFN